MSETHLSEYKIDVDGLKSPVLEAGRAHTSEAAVFVHGNPGSSLDWQDLVRRVGSFGRAVAFDMPGFGRADKPADFEYTVWGYARHLGRLIEEFGIDRVHLILHDFGGPWGLLWAASRPELFASVTLINTGVLPGYRWHTLARIWRTPIVGEAFQAVMGTRWAFGRIFTRGNPANILISATLFSQSASWPRPCYLVSC